MMDPQNHYTENYLIEFENALELIRENTNTAEEETVTLSESNGRIVSQDIVCKEAVPAFDNSAMDGFAVCNSALEDASEAQPVRLPILGISAAGEDTSSESVKQSDVPTAWKIMTGALVPTPYDTVIPIENCVLNGEQVTFNAPKHKGANIRKAGEDFSASSPLLLRGQTIKANQLMALACQGIDSIPVYKKTSIAVFSTGRELVDDASIPLKTGQIRNSNKPFILQWLRQFPVEITDKGTNLDDAKKFEFDLLQQLELDTNIIISTGAVSMGDFDFIPKVIQKLGGKIIFHKVKIRPGKPILFAKFKNGSCFFGLPGNPISTVIGLRFFVAALLGEHNQQEPEIPIITRVKNSQQKKKGFRVIFKASAEVDPQGQMITTILEGQESFKISPLLHANGWAVIGEDATEISAESRIEFYPTDVR